jgi:hypothetical protein
MESKTYETLKPVQGDRIGITTKSLGGEDKGEGAEGVRKEPDGYKITILLRP